MDTLYIDYLKSLRVILGVKADKERISDIYVLQRRTVKTVEAKD